MVTAREILNFSFSPVNLQYAGKNILSIHLTSVYEVRISKLKKITTEVGESSFKFKGEIMIPQVFKKFKTFIKTGGLLLENFEIRELKTLTYSLSYSDKNNPQIFSNPNELDRFFEILEANWRDSYLIGLIEFYLKSWESKYSTSIEKLGNFIFRKLKKYEGGRIVLKSFKSNLRYFESKIGNVLLGSDLAIKNKQIIEATKFLSLPDSWFVYPYFSKVILAYYERKKSAIHYYLDDLNNALHEHNSSRSNKRLVSKLIIQANSKEFGTLQDKIKSIAFKLIGDPSNFANWAIFENASESEKDDLMKARNILNEWITKQFINVFFEKCINDPRRKKFWLKYAKHIIQFRVVGSANVKSVLLLDKRISEYVEPRFTKTNSSNSRNSALMFIMNSHLFIEFSDEGAFYTYKISNPKAPSIENPRIYSTSDLKDTSMPRILYRTGTFIDSINEEGRCPHNDGTVIWENIAKYWISEKLHINV